MNKILVIYLVLTWFTLAACGRTDNSKANEIGSLAPVPPDFAGLTNPLGADAAAAGTLLFKNNCASCHGPQGLGDGPAAAALDPAPKNLANLQKIARDDYLFWRISTGREGTAMVAWKSVLTDEQIWQVIAFLRSLK
jgi:mono/diheme cytochrome c family protein